MARYFYRKPGMSRFIVFFSSLLCICASIFAQSRNTFYKTDTVYLPLHKNDNRYKHLKVYIDSSKILRQRAKEDSVKRHVASLNVTPATTLLDVHISVVKSVISEIAELKIYILVTNKTSRTQKFLFDRPARVSGGIWAASCTIKNAAQQSVLKFPVNTTPEVKKYTAKELEHYDYVLGPGEWIMKSYPVYTLVTFDEKLLKKGKLPPGKYTLQLNFQNNPSNVVSFTAR